VLIKLHNTLEDSAKTLNGVADDLSAKAGALQGQMLKQMIQILMPNLGGTAPNAIAFGLYASLERLHGTILSAARNYAAASETLLAWAVQLKQLEDAADDAGWDVARRRAILQHQIEHEAQFRCELTPAETEEQKRKRAFWEALTRPGALTAFQAAESKGNQRTNRRALRGVHSKTLKRIVTKLRLGRLCLPARGGVAAAPAVALVC
jgi:hypothetical protein